MEKLAATHEASINKVDEHYEWLTQALNQLLTENQRTADLAQRSSETQEIDLDDFADNQVQHEKRLQTAFVSMQSELQTAFVPMQSELSALKSAVKDLHDQTHKEEGLGHRMQELRLQRMEQVSQVRLILASLPPSIRALTNAVLSRPSTIMLPSSQISLWRSMDLMVDRARTSPPLYQVVHYTE